MVGRAYEYFPSFTQQPSVRNVTLTPTPISSLSAALLTSGERSVCCLSIVVARIGYKRG